MLLIVVFLRVDRGWRGWCEHGKRTGWIKVDGIYKTEKIKVFLKIIYVRFKPQKNFLK